MFKIREVSFRKQCNWFSRLSGRINMTGGSSLETFTGSQRDCKIRYTGEARTKTPQSCSQMSAKCGHKASAVKQTRGSQTKRSLDQPNVWQSWQRAFDLIRLASGWQQESLNWSKYRFQWFWFRLGKANACHHENVPKASPDSHPSEDRAPSPRFKTHKSEPSEKYQAHFNLDSV